MSWNYRVVRGAQGLSIFDVYYDAAGKPVSTHVAPTYVCGESIDELKSQIELMRAALSEPILDEAEIGCGAAGTSVT
jgi:hypothetical protein